MFPGSMVRCLSPSFVKSSFPSVNRNTDRGKNVLRAFSCTLPSHETKEESGEDLEVSEEHCTNRGYVIVPEPNKASLPLHGGGGKEGGSRRSPSPHTFNTAEMSSSRISPASGVPRNLFAALLSVPLTFTSQTVFFFFLQNLTSSPFENRPGNPDLIKL